MPLEYILIIHKFFYKKFKKKKKSKEIVIFSFFHKIVLLRERLINDEVAKAHVLSINDIPF